MKPSLQPGVAGAATYTVTADMSPPHLPTKVLSTPSMVQLIEATCLQTAQLHLDDGETTVGTHVCVSHAASAAAGEQVDVTCEITEIDRRRLEFATRVTSGDKGCSRRAPTNASSSKPPASAELTTSQRCRPLGGRRRLISWRRAVGLDGGRRWGDSAVRSAVDRAPGEVVGAGGSMQADRAVGSQREAPSSFVHEVVVLRTQPAADCPCP